MDQEPLYELYAGTREAAETLGVHWGTVHRMIREEQIPAVEVTTRYLIPRDELEAFARRYDNTQGRKRAYWKTEENGRK